MGVYDFLLNAYYQILGVFPAPVQWLISLAVLVMFVWLFWNLIKSNALFLILLVLVLPMAIPILARLFTDLWQFFLFLLRQVGVGGV
jgi:hypothetical protein